MVFLSVDCLFIQLIQKPIHSTEHNGGSELLHIKKIDRNTVVLMQLSCALFTSGTKLRSQNSWKKT